jgi:PTS system mannose-specific IIA component
MLGIVITTHGELAKGLYDAANLIVGVMNHIEICSLTHGDSAHKLHESMQEAVKSVDQGNGVIIMTDLLSGTPYNQALLIKKTLTDHKIEVVSGANLPMLISLINHQLLSTPFDKALESTLEEAKKGIVLAALLEADIEEEF